jgi:hypothetical protein
MNIAYKIVLILFFINSYSQIVPLNSIETPQGAYEKDLDNILPFWVGTWKGTSNNVEYTFVFDLYPETSINNGLGSSYFRDELVVKFSVKNLVNNEILYSDLNITNVNDYKINFLSNIGSDYYFSFNDDLVNCNNSAEFVVGKFSNNSNQFEYKHFRYVQNISYECNYVNQFEIPLFLPKISVIFFRQ